ATVFLRPGREERHGDVAVPEPAHPEDAVRVCLRVPDADGDAVVLPSAPGEGIAAVVDGALDEVALAIPELDGLARRGGPLHAVEVVVVGRGAIDLRPGCDRMHGDGVHREDPHEAEDGDDGCGDGPGLPVRHENLPPGGSRACRPWGSIVRAIRRRTAFPRMLGASICRVQRVRSARFTSRGAERIADAVPLPPAPEPDPR